MDSVTDEMKKDSYKNRRARNKQIRIDVSVTSSVDSKSGFRKSLGSDQNVKKKVTNHSSALWTMLVPE